MICDFTAVCIENNDHTEIKFDCLKFEIMMDSHQHPKKIKMWTLNHYSLEYDLSKVNNIRIIPIKKCECFCNGNCSVNCPNQSVYAFEDRYDLPASEIGLETTKCRSCSYRDSDCTCYDCYFIGSKNGCPNHEFTHWLHENIIKEWELIKKGVVKKC